MSPRVTICVFSARIPQFIFAVFLFQCSLTLLRRISSRRNNLQAHSLHPRPCHPTRTTIAAVVTQVTCSPHATLTPTLCRLRARCGASVGTPSPLRNVMMVKGEHLHRRHRRRERRRRMSASTHLRPFLDLHRSDCRIILLSKDGGGMRRILDREYLYSSLLSRLSVLYITLISRSLPQRRQNHQRRVRH